MEVSEIGQLKEEFLTCPLCDEDIFQDGRDFHILPVCQHSLCERCVEGIVERRKEQEPLLCPWCRQEFILPDSGKLPTFRYASELHDKLKVYATSKKKKSKGKGRPTQVPAVKERKPKPGKLVPLGRFAMENILYETVCAGRNGMFYGRLSCEDGLASINWLAGGKVQKFGNLQSCYSDMVFDGVELFAFNSTQRCIEVYKDHQMVRSWRVCGRGTTFAKLKLCPGGRVMLVDRSGWEKIRHFSEFGKLTSAQGINERGKRLLVANTNVFSAHNSLWIFNSNDEHLWEIPVEEKPRGIRYLEPVKHCQVGYYQNACQWGMDKILYTAGSLVKVIDLAAIKSVKAPSGGRRHSIAETRPTINHLLTSEYNETDDFFFSRDGFMLTIAGSSASLFKLMQPEQESPVDIVSMATENIPGPEYPSRYEVMENRVQYYIESFSTAIGNFIYNLLVLLLLIHLFRWIWPNQIKQSMSSVGSV